MKLLNSTLPSFTKIYGHVLIFSPNFFNHIYVINIYIEL